MAPKVRYITVEAAMGITGRQTKTAVKRFIENWNVKNLDHLILRIPGHVEENSLRHALDLMAQAYTPGMAIRRAITAGSTTQRTKREKAAPAHTGTASYQKRESDLSQ